MCGSQCTVWCVQHQLSGHARRTDVVDDGDCYYSFVTKRPPVVPVVFTLRISGFANMNGGGQRTLSGAAIGAGAGALIGSLAKRRPVAGAAWGAAAGDAGRYLHDRHER